MLNFSARPLCLGWFVFLTPFVHAVLFLFVETNADNDAEDEEGDDDDNNKAEAQEDDDAMEQDENTNNDNAEEAQDDNEVDAETEQQQEPDELTPEEATDVAAWKDAFEKMHVSILRGLRDVGFTEPTAIQTAVMKPALVTRKDVMGAAETVRPQQTHPTPLKPFIVPNIHVLLAF